MICALFGLLAPKRHNPHNQKAPPARSEAMTMFGIGKKSWLEIFWISTSISQQTQHQIDDVTVVAL